MTQALVTVSFGLAASLFWGSGDFFGGLASRRSNAVSVVTAVYTTGFLLLSLLALISGEHFPSVEDCLWGGLAGLSGAVGLVAFYQALAIERMGIIAPVSALLTAGLPVLFSAFTEGLPNLFQLAGFLLALVAIILISRPERARGGSKGIWLALIAGCGFGVFFIFISRIPRSETLWPLAVARLVSVLFLLLVARVRRQSAWPGKAVILLVMLAGGLDALGNVLFVLAAHSGRLDIASVLSSLYPAATVVLASIILRERVTRIQGLGIFLALVAIPLIFF